MIDSRCSSSNCGTSHCRFVLGQRNFLAPGQGQEQKSQDKLLIYKNSFFLHRCTDSNVVVTTCIELYCISNKINSPDYKERERHRHKVHIF